MIRYHGYRFRIYPTLKQAARLEAWSNALRWLWNIAHEQRLLGLARPKGERKYFTAFDQIYQLKDLRAELPWLEDVPRDVCGQLLIELDKAWQQYFRKLGEQPRWKRKGLDTPGICCPIRSQTRRVGFVKLPKIGHLRVIQHRPIEGTPKTITISRDVDQWFASITSKLDVPTPTPRDAPIVAIDRGVVNLIADSNGNVTPNPKFLTTQARRLARAQRRVARTKKGSANRSKRLRTVAKIHRQTRRQREHVLHVLSHNIAKNHGVVIVEGLSTRNMTTSARGTIDEPGTNVRAKSGLNRSILDAGWGKLVDMLRYKLAWSGGTLVEVPAAYSSQTCANCGVIDAASRRSQSEFVCVACGHQDHADVNAAKVLLSRRADDGAVCGGSPVAGPTKQKLRVVRRGKACGNQKICHT